MKSDTIEVLYAWNKFFKDKTKLHTISKPYKQGH